MGQTILDEHLSRETYFLLGCGYDGKAGKAYLKLLEPRSQKTKIIYDESGHRPYCYVKAPPEEVEKLKLPGVVGLARERKYDLLRDTEVDLTKILASDPLAVGGGANSIRERVEAWEADIPYHLCYLYDMGLTPCMPYQVEDGKLIEVKPDERRIKEILDKVFQGFSEDEKRLLSGWISLLEAEQPKFKHLSLDIEVLSPVATRVPSPSKAKDKVIAVSLVGSDGRREVYLLRTPRFEEPEKTNEFEIKVFDDEVEMLRKVYEVILEYPIIATFNGDDFDMPYLRHRGEVLKIPKDQIPITLGREGASLRHGIHIDLYKLFMNKSIQVYAFDNRYREHTLEAIAQAILGKGKVAIEKPVSELSSMELANYSFQDALLVHELLTFDDELILKLLVVLSRISRMPIEDVCRHGVSGWIKSLLYYEHRRRGCLIPRSNELIEEKGVVSTKAVIEGKKYRGAIVVEPLPGVHFNVTVLDFASLYPSVLKEWNLSYETVRCIHPECRDNVVPETTHWICKKRRGIQSEVIGCLRDIRVEWYKPMSGDKSLPESQRRWYSVVQKALKVFLNAAYGVFGFEGFSLYCPPVAESTAAIARYAFKKTIEKVKDLGITIIYGDTVSGDAELFIRRGDIITRLTMREFYEMEKSRNGAIWRDGKECVPCSSDVEVLTLNRDGQIAWSRPKLLISHMVSDWFEITTYTGRRIKVTGDHSLYVLRDMDIVPIKVSELTSGDYIAVPKAYPPSHSLTKVDLIEFQDMLGETIIRDGKMMLAKNSECALPTTLHLDSDLMWFFGLWLGDGSYDGENGIEISVFDEELQERIIRLAKRLHIKPLIDRRKGIRLPSRLFVRVMKYVLGFNGNAYTKRLPPWYMSLPDDLLIEFLKGLFQADGSILYNRGKLIGVKLNSRSEQLIRDVQTALLRLGIIGYVRRYKDVNPYTKGTVYRLIVSGQNGRRLARLFFNIEVSEPRIKDVNDVIPLNERSISKIINCLKRDHHYLERVSYLRAYKRAMMGRRVAAKILEWLDEGVVKDRLRWLVDSDVLWDKVVKIRRLSKPELGFDINVPETQNFIASNIIAHNTDSIFLKTENEKLIDDVVKWAKQELKLDLELDKKYRYIVFSTRKKNYLGVTDKGVVDVKGLTGKKRHIPKFIKEAFEEMLSALKEVEDEKSFEKAKKRVEEIVKTWYYKLKKGEFELEDLSFKVMLSRSVERYVKTTPPHVKAAKKLMNRGVQVAAGDIISYVKTKDRDGVEPLEFARKDQIDIEKYVDYLLSTFGQVLDALEIDFDKIIGVTSLEHFM